MNICPVCHGRGTEIVKPCPTCGGYGQIEKEEVLNIIIPAGIDDGTVLRIAGHGLPGEQPRSSPGDLHVAVYTKPDGRFQRRGPDLWRAETIEITDAVLGTTLVVPTIQGQAKVKVPPGTQADEVLRLRGKGLSRYHDKGRGDLNLRIRIHIPKKLSKEERALYERIKRLAISI